MAVIYLVSLTNDTIQHLVPMYPAIYTLR